MSTPESAPRDEKPQPQQGHGDKRGEDNRDSDRRKDEKRSDSRSPERRRTSITAGPTRSDEGNVPSTPITKVYQPNSASRNYSSTNVALSPQLNGAVSVKPSGGSNVLQKSPRRPIPAVPSSPETAGFWRSRRNTAVGVPVNIGNPVLDVSKCRFKGMLVLEVLS